MDFYDDIDVDFGDKSGLSVGEMINLLEDNPGSKSEKRKKNRKKTMVIFEDEVDDEECENYHQTTNSNYLSNCVDPDLIGIAEEVSQVTGNRLLNEHLEERYRQNTRSRSTENEGKIKVKSASKETVRRVNSNITKKSDLRKEMASAICEAETNIAFAKKKNALVNSLAEKKPEVDYPDCPKYIENDAEAAEEQIDPPATDMYKMIRVRNWLNGVKASSSEDDFQSPNSTLNTTDGSASYFTASSPTLEQPKKSYRATSKRSSMNRSPNTNTMTDANVGFKTATKKTPPLSKAAPSNSALSKVAPSNSASSKPAPSNSASSKPARSNSGSSKSVSSKSSPPKHSVYIPGSYNREFKLQDKDFPAIR